MKKTQLLKLIREVIKEQSTPWVPNNQMTPASKGPARPPVNKPTVSPAQVANEIGCRPNVPCLSAYSQYYNATNGGGGNLPTPQELQQKFPNVNRPMQGDFKAPWVLWLIIVGGAWLGSKGWRDNQ